MKSKKAIYEIEKIINYSYKNKKILVNSLTHPSIYKDKNKKLSKDFNEFERLEFLGDRVLGICIASLIFNKFDNYNEGSLTKKLSYLVQREFLYKIALQLKLDDIIKYSYKKESIRMNKSILADSLESLIGGIFIDGGYRCVFNFINRIWGPYLDVQESNEQDPKTKLQEISQKKLKILPEYNLIKKEGPPHSPIFEVSLKALKLKIVKAKGKSKQEAEKNAAKKILDLISEKKIN